ncbi:hypothetical protein CEXT_798411 [Caerostris extrusa]|uniref:Uncharacterized protein n=1 Tax=Caerostris extrusa TaxID=172846 RepID=A0AAV4WS97_CAEEX|nr:hypothetical protein CEXT_798411 [Caerostris extrusa]
MAIWNCEFCNAYVTDFEVHYCRSFGDQHRQSSATLPRSSSVNLVPDIDSRLALPRNYDEGRSVMGQINSSAQQSVLSNIHLRTTCEETATAEIPSQFGNANQNQYNPEISDSLFPNMAHGEETPSKTTPLTEADQLNPMHVAEPCILPGFQEAFGQRNTLINQLLNFLAHLPIWNVLEYFTWMKRRLNLYPTSMKASMHRQISYRNIMKDLQKCRFWSIKMSNIIRWTRFLQLMQVFQSISTVVQKNSFRKITVNLVNSLVAL